MIKIVVNGQSISGEYTKTASDSIDYLRVCFTFSDEWEGTCKTAQFTQNGKTYNVILEDGACIVPSEISEGKLDISVFGQKTDGTLRITTLPFEINVLKSGFVPDGEDPIPPTPDLYSQLVSKVEKAVENIPEKLSEFENDKGFITGSDIPKKLSGFENDKGFITSSDIPKKLSAFENDKGFITSSDIPKKVSEFENDKGFITNYDIPKKVSAFENDKGFITNSAVPKKLSSFQNDKGYITSSDVPKNLSAFENDENFVSQSYVDEAISNIDVDVPTKISELENDKNFVTNTQIYSVFKNIKMSELQQDLDSLKIGDFNITHSKMPGSVHSSVSMKGVYAITLDEEILDVVSRITQVAATSSVDLRTPKITIGSSSGTSVKFTAGSTITGITEPTEDSGVANKKYVDTLIGDINTVLDELHIYAQSIASGGVSE